MLTLLACVALAHVQQSATATTAVGRLASNRFHLLRQESNHLRSILPNGAVTWVEHIPHAERLIVQLFVSSQTLPNNRRTNGLRHLLEHLTALGRNRDVDQILESQGAFLTAQTMREATVYQMCLRPGDILLALDTVKKIMQLGDITQEQIVKESQIIRQESVLETTPQLLADAAWEAAFGSEGADPVGDPDEIETMTPEALGVLHQQQFVGKNLTLVISGDLDLDGATAEARSVLMSVPSSQDSNQPSRSFRGGGTTSCDAPGAAIACFVDSWNSPKTAARLAAALSIAAGLRDSFVTYTPSLRGSLVIVGQSGETNGLDRYIATLNPAGEFGIGRSLAKAWVDRQTSLQTNNTLSGLLLSEGPGQRAETLGDNLDQMTVEQFTAALNEFRSRDSVKVIGK